MKRKYFLILAALFCVAAYGQDTFAPVGAEWYYGINGGYWYPYTNSYQTFEVIKDTVIEGNQCSVLEVRYHTTQGDIGTVTGYEYLHQELQKVYRWFKNQHEFALLYDFSANIGDMLDILVGDEYVVTMQVTDVDIVDVSGVPLRQLHLSSIESLYSFGATITERIGGSGYMFPDMFGATDGSIPSLRCYDDGEISFHLMQCDEVTTSIGETSNEQSNLIVCDDYVQLPIKAEKVDFYNVSGQLITSIKPDNSAKISTAIFATGIYFIKAYTANFNCKSFKFLKK